jgi:orotidine-5'-phosphate decarboxylase
MNFQAKLAGAVEANNSLLCVGLDPDPEHIPPNKIVSCLVEAIDATCDLVCAYKPNLAFYEQLGPSGYHTLADVLAAIPPAIPTIADAKRGDVGHTAAAYARAIFDQLGFDAATVNPYLGGDSVEPFLERPDKTAFIVCRTSNPGATDIQDLTVEQDGVRKALYVAVAERAAEWNVRGNVGLVAGATYPEDMRRLRTLCPEMPFLVPGIGAQGASLEEAVASGLDAEGRGIIVNASRTILYASGGKDAAAGARNEALRLRDAINRARHALPASQNA